MRKPYRMIVWGPGAGGCAALRELHRRPEFDIVGVLAYSKDKIGKDVGELINAPPMNIRVTGSKADIFKMNADCVVYTPQYVADAPSLEIQIQDAVSILESGKSLVTPTNWFYPHLHGEAYVKRFEDACRKGSASMFTGGENPGFWLERLALTLTAMCTEVEQIRLSEYADVSLFRLDTLTGVGFGQSVEVADKTAQACVAYWEEWSFADCLQMVSKALFGRHLDRVEARPHYLLAEKELVFDRSKGDPFDLVIKPGQVQAVSYEYLGHLDGKVRIIDRVNWYIMEKGSPYPGKEDSVWDIEIEGRPASVRCSTKVMASLKDKLERRPGDPTLPTWYATIVPILQAIPIVCSRKEPGIVYPSIFTTCVEDFRRLETRKTLVD